MTTFGARVLLAAMLAAPGALRAQHPPVVLPDTEQRILTSEENGVSYKLYVSLPGDYDTSGEAYPIVFLLDGDYSSAIARNVVEHLSDRNHLTPAVLVGIPYDGPPSSQRRAPSLTCPASIRCRMGAPGPGSCR